MSDLVERLRGRKEARKVGGNIQRTWAATTLDIEAADRITALENALAEIARRGALCIHQNIGRWDMSIEHDKRSYNIIDTNNRIALDALKDK